MPMVSSEQEQREIVSIWEFLLGFSWEFYTDSQILDSEKNQWRNL